MNYTFTQKVEKDDYVSFVVNHMKYSFYKPLNIVLFTVSIGYLMVSPFLMPADERNYTFTLIGVGLILLLIALTWFAKRGAEKQYDRGGGAFEMTYEITDESLIYKVDEGEISKNWNEFYSAMETDNYIYIYVNKQRGMVILKKAISGDMMDFIKGKLVENLKPRRLKLK